MTASAAYYRSPFDIDNRVDYPEIEAGRTVREFLEASQLWDELSRRPIVVSLNNVQLVDSRGDYERVLVEGDRLTLSAMPTEPGSTAYLIFQIFAVVAAVASIALVLTADEPETGEGDETDSPNQNLNARGNRARMGQPLPVLYGRHRVFPDLSSTPYDAYDRNGDQVVWLLYELTIGECDVELGTARFEDTLLSNFPDAQIEVIPPGSTSTVFTNEVVTSTEVSNVDVEATSGGAAVAYAINPPATTITGFSIDVSAPSIYRQRPNSGTFTRYSVSLVVEYREIDDAGVAVGSWTLGRQVYLSGSTQKIIQRTERFTVPEGRYEARVYRTVAKAGTTRIADTVFFEALRGYYADSLPVSNSTRIALRIRASNQIGNRSLTKFSVIATRKLLGIQSGQFTASTSATRSAALAFADICTSAYGGKRALSFVDMQKLEALGTQLALEGITCDGVIDSNINVLPALKRVASLFQGSPIEKNGVQSFARDIAVTTPVQVYSMENIYRGSFKTQQIGVLAETADHVIIEFFDEDQDYRLASVECIPPGASTNNPRVVRLWGVTNRDRAWERGMHMAGQNRYRRERLSFETGIEGRIPTYLDLILVSHAVLGVAGTEQKSGRISDFSGSVLDVTEDCTATFTSPFITFPKLSGEPVGPYACTVLSETQIQINETFDNSGLDFTPGYELPRFIIGEGSEFATQARVTLVERAGTDRLRIEAFIDAPEVYTVTSGEVPPAAVSLENLLDRLPRVENLQVAGFGSPREPSILLTWEGQNADRYDVEYSIDAGTTWIDVTDEVIKESRFEDSPDESLTSIRYRVAPLSVYRGDWVEVNVADIAALIENAVPPPPTGLDVQSVASGVAVTVRIADNPNEGVPDAVEIYRVTAPETLWTGASRVLIDSYPVTPDPVNDRWIAQYIDADVTGDETYSYFARTVNSFDSSARFPADPGAGVPVTVTAPGSGGSGPAGADAIAASPVIFEWLKAKDGGAWAPVVVTQDAVLRFIKKNVEVSTHTVRATLNQSAGTITVADQGETGEDTNITATTGAGTSLVRVEITHVSSGAIGIITFKAVQGGSEGSAGSNGVSGRIGAAVALDYDDADTTGAAVGNGGYAFLTTLDANNTSGTVDWGELTDGSVLALLINATDLNGFDQTQYLSTLAVGDPFEFVQDPQKWLSFTITSIETHPSGRFKFGVTLVSFDERANQGDLNTAAGNPVTFRFGRAVNGADGPIGPAGMLPANIKVIGDMTVGLFKNQDAAAAANPGEIRITPGYLRASSESATISGGPVGTETALPLLRTLTTSVQLNTPFEGAGFTESHVFYVVHGATSASTRFPTLASLGTAAPQGFFSALYDPSDQSWLALGNDGIDDTEAFTPSDTDYLVAVGYKAQSDTEITQIQPLGGVPADMFANANSFDLPGRPYNSFFSIPIQPNDPSAGIRPAGWFVASVTQANAFAVYSNNGKHPLGFVDENPYTGQMRISQGNSDDQVYAVSMAVPVRPDTTYLIRVRWRHTGASARTAFVRVAELDADLPEGKAGITRESVFAAPDWDTPYLEERTREITLSGGGGNDNLNSVEVPTTWEEKQHEYTPTSTAKWFSLNILNWDALDGDLEVERITVEPQNAIGPAGSSSASIDLVPAFTQWTQAPNGGSWSPGATTNDVLIEARIGGAVVAAETWRVTRDSNGDLTAAIQGANDGDISVSITGSGSSALTLVADFDDGTLQASKSQTITTVKGGTNGGAGPGVAEVGDSAQASISGAAAIVHPSQGNLVELSVIGTCFGFAGSQGPASSTLELRNDANTVIASFTVTIQWTFESELFTWSWSGTPINVNLVVAETPGIGNKDYTLSWSAGSAAPFSVGPLLRSTETVGV